MTSVGERILAELGLLGEDWHEPILICVMGLPCSGKTVVSGCLAARLPLVVLSTDRIRLEHGLPSGPAAHEVMLSVATGLLDRRIAVVFDGIHLSRAHRDDLRRFADGQKARFELIYTIADDPVIEARLRSREVSPEQTADAANVVISPGHFVKIHRYLEPPGSGERVWTVDTSDSEDVPAQLEPLEEHLRSRLEIAPDGT
jgi:predicted kinase